MDKSQSIRILLFSLFLILWLTIFLIGTIYDANDYLKLLNETDQSFLSKIKYFICVMGTYTWSNILLLCCFASLLGEYGRITMGRNKSLDIMAALIRGFFIFLFLTAGQLIFTGSLPLPDDLGTDAALKTSPEDYFRLSGVCSLFAFYVGIKPELFKQLIARMPGGA